MIYLAAPYSNNEVYSFGIVTDYAVGLMNEGLQVYSPITHGHTLHLFGCTINHLDWLNHGLKMMLACTEVYVLMLPGWTESKGVAAEIKNAHELGLKVTYIEP